MKLFLMTLSALTSLIMTKSKTIDVNYYPKKLVCYNDPPVKAKVKLLETVVLPGNCGVIRHVGNYKFELLDSANTPIQSGHIINIEFSCPREMGEFYFQKGKVYTFTIQNKIATSNSNIVNDKSQNSINSFVFISK